MATRIEQLACPKPNLLRYPDRHSVYWLDKLPLERTGSITRFELSPRWLQLCRNRKSHAGFEQIRTSPIWEVTESALRACPSERLCFLAQPRLPPASWKPERPILAPLSRVVQNAVASQRICQLAEPKRRMALDGPVNESKTTLASSKPMKASSRIELLSTPKQDHPMYAGERPVSWPVPKGAMDAVASERVVGLSRPKERKALFDGYNPYVVSRWARSASASPRLQELCLPLPRKCRAK